jgi:cyclopropane fatty-acyl-phospholipid synthase-like methyltransferase
MAQITSGVRRVLSYPSVYNFLQNLLGAEASRVEFVSSYCACESGQRWLDIGCGTAELLKYLPTDCFYVGYDLSEQYISHAKEINKNRNAEFFAELVTEETLSGVPKFDRVAATGLLHHLEDDEVVKLFKISRDALAEGGRLITIDPCYAPEQTRISKALVDRDRGQNVRNLGEYYQLASSVFNKVQIIHRNNMLRIPYDHAIMICQ